MLTLLQNCLAFLRGIHSHSHAMSIPQPLPYTGWTGWIAALDDRHGGGAALEGSCSVKALQRGLTSSPIALMSRAGRRRC